MKKLLFATDFSDTSQDALNYLIAFVADLDVQIDLMHVFDIPLTMTGGQNPRSIKEIISNKKARLEKEAQEVFKHIPVDQQGECHVIYGVYPSSEIRDLSRVLKSDLVVMGLRQKYSLIDRLMGTVTAHTIDKIEQPVLVIPQGAKFNGINRIVFPTMMANSVDLSQSEEEALAKLVELAKFSSDTEIDMIHVDVDAEKRAHIDEVFKNRPLDGFTYTRSFADSVDVGIMKYLESGDVDLLAFYRPHRSFWERIYHSSVSRKLLFQSRIPLFVFQ